MSRRKTLTVSVGDVKIGSRHPVAIQSMTNVPTTDVSRCAKQIKQLIKAGCSLVRIAVPTKQDTKAFAKIVERCNVPLIADVHFNADRAIEAIEGGAAKIRLNPGNIKNKKDIVRVIDAAKAHKTAIRIGVNEASIRDLTKADVPQKKRVKLMLGEMKKYVRIFEKQNFTQLVLSAKSSDTVRTIEINRLIAETFDYPIHLGLTHAGLVEDAQIPSAVALGTLLADGIGDTVRVSIAGNPAVEVEIAKKILSSLGLCPIKRPELIVCPTCGRAEINVISLAKKIKKTIANIEVPIRVAVMGCIVNGPGEARDADLAICAGKGKAWFYKKGKKIGTASEDKIITEFIKILNKTKL
ncbi:MAG: flavodoxin-dependent (E)-4-hydroxy-3-methylbut-2-enyl-diphosphate synthase [Sedimentisphaerales bacterium]|nr:flavodoxin-dependent (E)-4-hydroxy-3-methylbut-2-enyl-diphosphate synthase [Sedimentisphaerales bacterium]